MAGRLRTIWREVILPFVQRPPHLQVAALCHRPAGEGREVLLVTSRDTGRWVLPKGWPIRGLDAAGAALQEAWEEAGVVRGEAATAPIGRYAYDKTLATGLKVRVEVLVFPVAVAETAEAFPEADQRRRRWVPLAEAATMVDESGLRALLVRFQAAIPGKSEPRAPH